MPYINYADLESLMNECGNNSEIFSTTKIS